MAETGEIRGAPMTKRRIMMCVAVIVVAVACAPVVPPTSGAKIEKGQRFSGQVNGTEDGAVIYTFCPGAMWEGRRLSVSTVIVASLSYTGRRSFIRASHF